MFTPDNTKAGAALIVTAWRDGTRLAQLPDDIRPATQRQGYAIQAHLGSVMHDTVAGWKIAATSAQGQRHIGVDGPIAGRLFASKIHSAATGISLAHNMMSVAECEFVFVLGRDLPASTKPYSRANVLDAVAALHPGIELPNSRFADFANAGAPQLAADNACAHQMVIGEVIAADWRNLDLSQVRTSICINNEVVCRGSGADVLGHPLDALTWLANSHGERGTGLLAGQFVTTGVTGQPTPVSPGEVIEACLEDLGCVRVALT
jgi:2-keto-4-pentenoate hydratase